MSDIPSARRVFVSYSHADSSALESLFLYLRPHIHRGQLELWADTEIGFGAQWQDEIDRAMRRAELAVLLISQDFLASEFIAEVELPLLLQRQEAGELTILPVFWSSSTVARVEFEFISVLGEAKKTRLTKFQGFNGPDAPLDLIEREALRKKTFVELVERILGVARSAAPGSECSGVEEQSFFEERARGSLDAKKYEVFVSFAEPDASYARDLAERLELQGKAVFVSDDVIAAGTVLDDRLSEAVYRSRLVVAMLSGRSERARYQREDIRLAIELEEAGRLQIVPVYVDGLPAEPRDWEFGLRSHRPLDLRQLGVDETADRIGGLLIGEPRPSRSPAAPTPAPVARQTIGDYLHGASLRIDRTKQWGPLLETCRSRESAMFLLHGPRQQNLDLFIYRIQRFLGEECGESHDVVPVRHRISYSIPRSEFEWENHLRCDLAGKSQREGTAEKLLWEKARHKPVFLVFGQVPIARRQKTGDGGWSEVELEALKDFLGGLLPSLIARASEGVKPIRALVATHYDNEADSLVEALDDRAVKGCEGHGVLYQRLPPVHPLEWQDVKEHLDLLRERPPERVYQDLKVAFERLDQDESLEFRQILDLLAQNCG